MIPLRNKNFFLFFIIFFSVLPFLTNASIFIDEIMYDPSGNDDNREWLEIKNESGSPIVLSELRVKDKNGKHLVKDLSGGTELANGVCAVIVDNPDKFKIDYQNFTGKLLDSSLSLVNTSDTLSLIRIFEGNEEVLDSITYSKDSGGVDGFSLERIGNGFKSVTPSPGVCSGSLAGGENSPSNSVSQSSATQVIATASGNSGSISRFPVEPQIFSYIDGPKIVVTGVDAIFNGTTFGIDKKPLENARYVWSFGDGATKEGSKVFHSWNYPGTYMIVLETSVGEFNSSARQKVEVVAAKINISEIKYGDAGFVAVKNESNNDIDLSRWILQADDSQFIFPKNTIILSGTVLPFANSVTRFLSDFKSVSLFYPNGTLVTTFGLNDKFIRSAKGEAVQNKETSKLKVFSGSKTAVNISEGVREENFDGVNQTVYASSGSSTLLYANVSSSGISLEWILALIGLIGIGGLGVLFSRGGGRRNTTEKTAR
jgi:hypothetical protein